MERFFRQSEFDGGMADSDLIGQKNSFSDGVGVDIFSEPGVVKCSQKMNTESGDVVTDLCYFSINASDGNSYWFGDTGHVYKRTSGGVWSLVYEDSAAILGAAEFNDYIYWATSLALHRITTALAATETPWTTIDVGGVFPATLTAATWHPMVVQGLFLFIGNNTTIASVDDTGLLFTAGGTPDVTFSALPPEYTVIDLVRYDVDILIGASGLSAAGTENKEIVSARVFRWDTVSPTYISDDEIPENGFNCFIPGDNVMFAQIGLQGNIYQYDGSLWAKIRRIKGTNFSENNYRMIVYPGSKTSLKGICYFGVSNYANNAVFQGVYGLGRFDNSYLLGLVLQYPLNYGTVIWATGLKVGAVQSIGDKLLTAYKSTGSGAGYGVQITSTTEKFGAWLTTINISGDEAKSKTFNEYAIHYTSLPTGTDFGLYYYKNYSYDFFTLGSGTAVTLKDKTDYYKKWGNDSFEAIASHFQIQFTPNGNNTPKLKSFYVKWNEQGTI